MSDTKRKTGSRTALGRVKLPIHFGDQVVVSLLFNHDANPVHHRPDHAVQWLLGLAAYGLTGGDESLAQADAEERTYRLGTALLAQQDVVVMPGIMLAAICAERFTAPEDHIVSSTTTFTYPLVVPTKGETEIEIEAFEVPPSERDTNGVAGGRLLEIEAYGPRLTGGTTRLLKTEILVFRPNTSAEELFQQITSPKFEKLGKLAEVQPGLPALAHASAISREDIRRYKKIVELDRSITTSTWQAKIPRVLTEVIDELAVNKPYQKIFSDYYDGREDEIERRASIRRYVDKEVKYGRSTEASIDERVDELCALPQQLYARQTVVFDPRVFAEDGPAKEPHVRFITDLHLYEVKLRRGIHRFFTGGRLEADNKQVFMGEAMVTAQPLVTRELADFFYEINYDFSTLKLFEYPPRR